MTRSLSQQGNSFARALLLLLSLFVGLELAGGPPPACAHPLPWQMPDKTPTSSVAVHTTPTPVFAGFFDIGRGESGRKRGMQIAALGMCLALLIMFRSKH